MSDRETITRSTTSQSKEMSSGELAGMIIGIFILVVLWLIFVDWLIRRYIKKIA